MQKLLSRIIHGESEDKNTFNDVFLLDNIVHILLSGPAQSTHRIDL